MDRDDDLDLMALFPRLAQLGNVMNRGRLVDSAVQRASPGLDRPGLSVLVALRMADRPLRVGEIAHRMQVVGPHVTRLLNTLEQRGLVRRVPDPDDQRARLIELTPDGAAAGGRYLETILGWFSEALAGWSAEDRRTFHRLIGRFADDIGAHLSALDDGPSGQPHRTARDGGPCGAG